MRGALQTGVKTSGFLRSQMWGWFSSDSGALRESDQPSPTHGGKEGRMLQNNPQKFPKFICLKCETTFSTYGGKIPTKCPKCGCPEFEEAIKTKMEVVQK